MRVDLRAVLLTLAFVCFLASAVGLTSTRFDRSSVLAAGLALWALATLIG